MMMRLIFYVDLWFSVKSIGWMSCPCTQLGVHTWPSQLHEKAFNPVIHQLSSLTVHSDTKWILNTHTHTQKCTHKHILSLHAKPSLLTPHDFFPPLCVTFDATLGGLMFRGLVLWNKWTCCFSQRITSPQPNMSLNACKCLDACSWACCTHSSQQSVWFQVKPSEQEGSRHYYSLLITSEQVNR